MTLTVVEEDNRFRVEWQANCVDWLPDTPSNRKAMLVLLRCLQDESSKSLFTFQELSVLFDSDNRQASSGHMERFRECGSDILRFLTRKRKVDSVVVEAVTCEVLSDPMAEMVELQQRVNARPERDDLSPANIKVALEQIPYHVVRDAIRKQACRYLIPPASSIL